jgi:hypothetical protein
MRPGWKTSEFWFGLGAVVLSALFSVGVIPVDSVWMKVAIVAATVLTSLGYAVSRGIAKAGTGPTLTESAEQLAKKDGGFVASGVLAGLLGASFVAALLLLGSGCKTTLPGAIADGYKVIAGLSDVAISEFHTACLAEAQKCKTASTPEAKCSGWKSCDDARTAFVKGLAAIEDGMSATSAAWRAAKNAGVLQ